MVQKQYEGPIPNEWEPVPGYEGYYAHRDGKIASVGRAKWKILSICYNSDGYAHVGLGRGYGTASVHRLVAATFVPKGDPEHNTVMHLNDDPRDPRAENLRWGTMSDNLNDCFSKKRRPLPKGVNNGRSKLTKEQVLEIYNSSETNRALGKRFGVRDTTISNIRIGKYYTDITGGKNVGRGRGNHRRN